jgi:hypothetical protein
MSFVNGKMLQNAFDKEMNRRALGGDAKKIR